MNLNWIFPLIGIGALLATYAKKRVEKAVDKITVDFKDIKKKWPVEVVLSVFNPTPFSITTQFIKVTIKYKGITVGNISELQPRTLKPGSQDITLQIRPSLEALAFFIKSPARARKDKDILIQWSIGTTLYQVDGEKIINL